MSIFDAYIEAQRERHAEADRQGWEPLLSLLEAHMGLDPEEARKQLGL